MPNDAPERLPVPVPLHACLEPFPAVPPTAEPAHIADDAHHSVVADLRAVVEPGVLADLSATASDEPFVPVMYSRETAARMLGISRRTLDGYAAKKQINVRRFGRRVLISHAEVMRFSKVDHLGRDSTPD